MTEPAPEHWALIVGGVVSNIIVADEEFATSFAPTIGATTMRVDHLDPHPGIGWLYKGKKFSPPPVEETTEP